MKASGLLIINADDWGCDPETTDAIAATFARGAITSASAMVWRRDSQRAAELASEVGLPTGLHVNLDLSYNAPDVPEAARRDHALVCRSFAEMRHHRRSYSPWSPLHRLVAACITAQLDEFERLYGRVPTHVDGHHHAVELVPNAFLSPALARGTKLRNPSFGARSWVGRLRRNWRRPILRRRFATTARFADFRSAHPALGGSGIEEVLAWADKRSVELMVHPGCGDEREVLESPTWLALLQGRRLGSFADL